MQKGAEPGERFGNRCTHTRSPSRTGSRGTKDADGTTNVGRWENDEKDSPVEEESMAPLPLLRAKTSVSSTSVVTTCRERVTGERVYHLGRSAVKGRPQALTLVIACGMMSAISLS